MVLQQRDLHFFEALETMRVMNHEQAKVAAGFHSRMVKILEPAETLELAMIDSQEKQMMQNGYLAAKKRILRVCANRLRLTHPERSTLAEIGKGLDRKALQRRVCG